MCDNIMTQTTKEPPRTIYNPHGATLYYKSSGMTIRMDEQEAQRFVDEYVQPRDFTAPEIVHIEIIGECNFDCDYCYIPKEKALPTAEELHKLFEELADMDVFQLTFGGGEPFLREDICELARAADGMGLNVTVTTNGTLLRNFDDDDLAVFRQINLSYHDKALAAGFDLEKTVKRLVDAGILCGINFVMSKRYRDRLPEVLKIVKEYGISLLLLSYKPVRGDVENFISLDEIKTVAYMLRDERVKVGIDSLITGECYMGQRLATISCAGDVFPCSFVRESAGNVRTQAFEEIWKGRPGKVKCPYLY